MDAAIFSDCEAALKALRDPDSLRYCANKNNLILLQTGVELTRAYHVRSHPERYEADRTKWNRYMYGNYMADRASVGDWEAVGGVVENYPVVKVRAGDVISLLTTAPIWYWATTDGQPTLRTYTEIRAEDGLERYLQGRDRKRADKGLSNKWATRSVEFAAEAADLDSRSVGDRARIVRIT